MTSDSLAAQLLTQVLQSGFDAAGITDVDLPSADRQAFGRWLDHGHNAGMHDLRRYQQLRQHGAAALLDGARSVLVTAVSYAWPDLLSRHDLAVARFAQAKDYHKAIRKTLTLAIRSFARLQDLGKWRVCVDTAPLLERAYGRQAGLGFMGRNSLLISPRLGSYTLLAEVMVQAQLTPWTPTQDSTSVHCGDCRACVQACPAGAIVGDGVIDARRCLSYCTIEQRGDFGSRVPPLGQRIFGCDRCQEVCPFNRGIAPATNTVLQHRPEIGELNAPRVIDSDDASLRSIIAGTALRRTGLKGLRRNALTVLAQTDSS